MQERKLLRTISGNKSVGSELLDPLPMTGIAGDGQDRLVSGMEGVILAGWLRAKDLKSGFNVLMGAACEGSDVSFMSFVKEIETRVRPSETGSLKAMCERP